MNLQKLKDEVRRESPEEAEARQKLIKMECDLNDLLNEAELSVFRLLRDMKPLVEVGTNEEGEMEYVGTRQEWEKAETVEKERESARMPF